MKINIDEFEVEGTHASLLYFYVEVCKVSVLTKDLVDIYARNVVISYESALASDPEMTVKEFGLWFRDSVSRELMEQSNQWNMMVEMWETYGEVEMDAAIYYLEYALEKTYEDWHVEYLAYDVLREGLLAAYVYTDFYQRGEIDDPIRLADSRVEDLLEDLRKIERVDLNRLEYEEF